MRGLAVLLLRGLGICEKNKVRACTPQFGGARVTEASSRNIFEQNNAVQMCMTSLVTASFYHLRAEQNKRA